MRVTATITGEKGASGIRVRSSHLRGEVVGLEFRLTGPPGTTAGFYVEFEQRNDEIVGATLHQPAPQPAMRLERKRD